MSVSEDLGRYREHTASVPSGSRSRVWARLQGKRAPSSGAMVLRFACAAVAAFGITGAWLNRPLPSVQQREAFAVLSGAARIEAPSAGVFDVKRGALSVSTWGGPGVQLLGAGHHIQASFALFRVEVAGERVTVDVREGVVSVDGEEVRRRWPASAGGTQAATWTLEEPAEAHDERQWGLAQQAVQRGRAVEAIDRLAAVSASGLRAEAALVQKAELELRQLKNPAAAKLTLQAAEARFPEGTLAHEVALTKLEVLHVLHERAELAEAAADFLRRFPESERRAEVERLSAEAATR